MIKNTELLSMAEAIEYVNKEDSIDIKGFIKKFTKLKPKEAKELKKKLEGLDMMKLRAEQIIKIIDLLPENQEDLNKIVDISLDENETKKIIDIVKKFK